MVSHHYFLDQMQPYEANIALTNLQYADRNDWERTRLQIYSTASMFSKNKLSVTDIMKMPWDQVENEAPTTIYSTDVQRLHNTADQIANILNQQ